MHLIIHRFEFLSKLIVTLDGGWLSNKQIGYNIYGNNLMTVDYLTAGKSLTFTLTDSLQIARHLNKIERKFNIIFNLKEV